MFRSLPAFVCILIFAGSVRADVTIIRSPAVIEHKTFNPGNPPREMPKLSGNETAVTQTFFGSSARVGGNVVQTQRTSAGDYKASVKVGGIEMTLRMTVTVWTPENASPKLINHEEGHRKIAEHFYAGAEPIMRKQAEAMIGQTVTGEGHDVQSAVDNAFDNVIQLVGQKFLDQCEAPCNKAQEIYDQITENGTNAVKEDKAAEEAIAKANDQ